MKNLGILNTVIYFMRHGNTDPHHEDIRRPLSAEGVRRVNLAKRTLNVEFDHGLASTAVCTVDTAGIMLGNSLNAAGLSSLGSMYAPEDEVLKEKIEAMFRELDSAATLNDFLMHKEANAFMQLVIAAEKEVRWNLWEKLTPMGENSIVRDRKILVVGHHPFINGLIHTMFDEVPALRDAVLHTNLAEAEMFEVSVGKGIKDASILHLRLG